MLENDVRLLDCVRVLCDAAATGCHSPEVADVAQGVRQSNHSSQWFYSLLP